MRGFEDFRFEGFGTSGEAVLWTRAHPAVLLALPGMSRQALATLNGRGRDKLEAIPFLGTFPELTGAARDSFARAIPRLSEATTNMPPAWDLVVTSVAGDAPVAVTFETRVTLGAQRLYVTRRLVRP